MMDLSIGELDIALPVLIAEIIFIAVRHCRLSEKRSAGNAGLSPVERVVAATLQSLLHSTLLTLNTQQLL